MSISAQKVKVYVGKIEVSDDGKSAILVASTSRKDTRNEGKYLYSNWYIKLLKNAMKNVDDIVKMYSQGEKNENGFLVKKFPIVLNLAITNEPYENKEGQKVWKNLQVAAFEWQWPESQGGGGSVSDEDSDWLAR